MAVLLRLSSYGWCQLVFVLLKFYVVFLFWLMAAAGILFFIYFNGRFNFKLFCYWGDYCYALVGDKGFPWEVWG